MKKDFGFNFRDIVENTKDVVIVTKASPIDDPGPEIVYVNPAFTELTGYEAHEVIGKSPRILQSEQTLPEAKQLIKNALRQQAAVRTVIRNRTKYGKTYWLDIRILPLTNDQGEVTHFVAIERDVTQQKEQEERLEQMTLTDTLTGLSNRRAFNENLSNEFSRFQRNQAHYTLLMIDIDHFKKINDTYGHATGDEVLIIFSKLIASHLRQHDSISRLGGEEFCAILPQTTLDESRRIAHKLCALINAQPFHIEKHQIPVSISIGISEAQENDFDCYDALTRADKKLYEAKESGRNKVCF